MIAGHTSEGNAILTLKGNVEALTKAYKDEQKAAAASVISGSDKENTNVVKNYKNESKTGIKSAFKSAFTFNSDKSTVNGLSTTQKISYLERATNLSINELKNKSGSIGSDNVFRSLLKTYGLDTDSTDQEVTTIIQNMKADLSTYQAEVDEAMKGIKTKANAYFIYNSDYDNLNDEQINQISSLIDKALTEEIADTFNKDSDINSKFVQKIIDGIENNKEGISNAYKSLLTIDPNNMGDVSKDKQAIDGYIKKIADYIGTDAESLKKGLMSLIVFLCDSRVFKLSLYDVTISSTAFFIFSALFIILEIPFIMNEAIAEAIAPITIFKAVVAIDNAVVFNFAIPRLLIYPPSPAFAPLRLVR